MDKNDAIAIVGLGYVGLSTAVCFASKGFRVIGLDVDRRKVASLLEGKAPFEEQQIPQLLGEALEHGKLELTHDYGSAVSSSATVFVTVGTPGRRDGSIDLSQVKVAAKSIGGAILDSESDGKLVVVKSTVTPGTTNDMVRPIIEREAKGRRVHVVANPEFLREGNAVFDTLFPDRIIIGSEDKRSARMLLSLYRRFYAPKMPEVVLTSAANAEMTKYASNAFLATKISFINEIANLCALTPGADVRVVARGMGMDSRIGTRFLNAGLGFGGSCFPKDVRALLAHARREGAELRVAEAALKTNTLQPLVAVRLAQDLVGSLRGKRVAVLGLAFKPETDDMRESVALTLIRELKRRASKVVVYDPEAMTNARRLLGNTVRYGESIEDCLRGADCCIVATEWEAFSKVEPKDFKRLMKNPAVVDGRGVLEMVRFDESGVKFAVVGLGEARR